MHAAGLPEVCIQPGGQQDLQRAGTVNAAGQIVQHSPCRLVLRLLTGDQFCQPCPLILALGNRADRFPAPGDSQPSAVCCVKSEEGGIKAAPLDQYRFPPAYIVGHIELVAQLNLSAATDLTQTLRTQKCQHQTFRRHPAAGIRRSALPDLIRAFAAVDLALLWRGMILVQPTGEHLAECFQTRQFIRVLVVVTAGVAALRRIAAQIIQEQFVEAQHHVPESPFHRFGSAIICRGIDQLDPQLGKNAVPVSAFDFQRRGKACRVVVLPIVKVTHAGRHPAGIPAPECQRIDQRVGVHRFGGDPVGGELPAPGIQQRGDRGSAAFPFFAGPHPNPGVKGPAVADRHIARQKIVPIPTDVVAAPVLPCRLAFPCPHDHFRSDPPQFQPALPQRSRRNTGRNLDPRIARHPVRLRDRQAVPVQVELPEQFQKTTVAPAAFFAVLVAFDQTADLLLIRQIPLFLPGFQQRPPPVPVVVIGQLTFSAVSGGGQDRKFIRVVRRHQHRCGFRADAFFGQIHKLQEATPLPCLRTLGGVHGIQRCRDLLHRYADFRFFCRDRQITAVQLFLHKIKKSHLPRPYCVSADPMSKS